MCFCIKCLLKGWGRLLGLPKIYSGESSSAVEHWTVDPGVAGSNPVFHPFRQCLADSGTASAAESRRIAHGEGLLPRLPEMQFHDVFVVQDVGQLDVLAVIEAGAPYPSGL